MDTYVLVGQTPVPEPDILKWGEWFNTAERLVAKTEIPGGIVSTVFLGIDHRFSWEGPPLLFETMVFDEGAHGGDCWRCATWLEAEAQHARIVEQCRREKDDDLSAAV